MKWIAFPAITVALAGLALASVTSSDRASVRPLTRSAVALSVPAATLTASDTLFAIAQIADESGTLIGFEGVAVPWQRPHLGGQRLNVSAGSAADALTRLTSLDPRYEWLADAPVVHLRPRGAVAVEDFLNTSVPVFSVKDATAEDVLVQIHRIFDPKYPLRHGGVGFSVPHGVTTVIQNPAAH